MVSWLFRGGYGERETNFHCGGRGWWDVVLSAGGLVARDGGAEMDAKPLAVSLSLVSP